MKITLRCQTCQNRYPSSLPIWRCECGGLLAVDFHARFPREKIQRRKPTLWRYREALPIEHDHHIVSFEEGFTALTETQFFGKKIFVKHDHLFPTGSYKDRGASILVSKVKELGLTQVVEDSSGNAGAAIAAYCANAGIGCHIYVPDTASCAKLLQIRHYGAQLHTVQGGRVKTAQAAQQHAHDLYYASHSWNPYFFHGTKTFIFEVIEQLGWNAPDVLMLPVGNGTLLYGAFLGIQELLREKIIDSSPRIIGVQAKNCAPIAQAWCTHKNPNKNIRVKKTIAEGIAIEHPIRIHDILHAVQETKGEILTVTEKEIREALQLLHRNGYYVEPTSSVPFAALKKYHTTTNQVVILPLTGHGLKQTI